MVFVLWGLLELAGALPFVTTWKTTQANEAIVLPQIGTETAVTVDWGDGTPTSDIAAGCSSLRLNHTYDSLGLHNVSINGQIIWRYDDSQATKEKLVNILSWGDEFLVQSNGYSMFEGYPNLQVSALDSSQPKFLAGATLESMFRESSFNSPLNWDLTNVTSLKYMFAQTPLNQPITFRNTQEVRSLHGLFQHTPFFNQPFHFDNASGLTEASEMFYNASAFNQVVNLTNSSLLTNTASMFRDAVSFNQPITCDTSSVTQMSWMFFGATDFNQPVNFNTKSVLSMARMFQSTTKFNQPVNFDTRQVTSMDAMFMDAESFNHPINFNTPKLTSANQMFLRALSFNQPVVMDTSNVTDMDFMFAYASNFSSTVTFTSTAKVTFMRTMFIDVERFTQDLSSWDTQLVTACDWFCPWCGLPAFPSCQPCPVGLPFGQCSTNLPPSPDPSNSSSVSAATTTTTPAAAATVPHALAWAMLLSLAAVVVREL